RLADLGNLLAAGSREFDAAELYRGWRHSRLHGERYPARLMVWSNSTPAVDVALHAVPLTDAELGAVALSAPPGQAVIQLAAGPGVHHVLTRRLDSARVLVVAVAPRTRLVPPATLGRVLEGEPPPLYEISLTPSPSDSVRIRGRWRREGWALRASRRVMLPGGPHEANMVIPLGRPVTIGVRGSLLLIADVAAVVLLWLAAAGITGVPVRIRFPLFRRSYETRLALALAGFTVVPAALLSALSVRQLALEAGQSRTLVLQRILRDATAAEGETVRGTARRLDTSIGIYRQGRLESASEPVLPALGLLPPLLEPEAWHALVLDGDPFVAPQSQGLALTGYVPLARNGARVPTILGTVEPLSDRELLERQLDIAFFFVLAALLGVIAAITGARFAARMLSRPVDELRHTALALGRGLPAPPRQVTPTREFEPVFDAFGRMAADVRAGRDALETARRRTEAVLATVSTGVVAVDGGGLVILANRTAEEMLGVPLARGEPFATLVPPGWQPLLRLFQADGSPLTPLELDDAGRRYAVQVAQLEAVGGWVVAINDVTQATRAARVLAWADVANQVAHAIKNPLTPLRLGIQHLQRVRHRHPEQFDTALVETSQRLLDEIERLDAMARGFSRFAAPSETTLLPDWVPLEEVAREVAALHHLAPGLAIRVEAPADVKVKSRRDELKEVLLNLCDNSRNAGARTVIIGFEGHAVTVSDDGHGIAPEILPHIFEPRFSTTSSGSGLGLAIVRRVVEGWGATISVASEAGKGARFLIDFPEGSTIRGAAE
ncbi:MAG TPA: ATP-binding protein, partial [Gemmatimonadales bacterium]|nr:ATP-binding protein [Gemmatimonadales bacterium]